MSRDGRRTEHIDELAIVGGGPAGMSAALVAGRARLGVVVINEESPRSAVTGASHGFLTRDGTHPDELAAIAREQLARYESVRHLKDRVATLTRDGDVFVLELIGEEALFARRVVLAHGEQDDLGRLGVPGLEEVYGTSAFSCPFCDGYEHRGQRLAIFGGAGVEHFGRVVKVWSSDIVVFTNGTPLDDEALEDLGRGGVRVEREPIERLISAEGRLREAIRERMGIAGARRRRVRTHQRPGPPRGRRRPPWLRWYCRRSRRRRGCAEGIVHELAQERWA